VGEWRSNVGAAGFVALVCVWMHFCCSACVRDCRGTGVCTVGIVGWLAGGECVGGWGSVG
jgi:hypothetical protein